MRARDPEWDELRALDDLEPSLDAERPADETQLGYPGEPPVLDEEE